MNTRIMIITLAIAGAIVLAGLQSAALAKSDRHVGYLSDVMCAKNKVSGGGFDLTTEPQKHTVMCMKMKPCWESGFGIYMKEEGSGKYAFYQFDQKGTDLAKAMLEKTDKKDNVKISVTGSIQDGMFKVDSLTAA